MWNYSTLYRFLFDLFTLTIQSLVSTNWNNSLQKSHANGLAQPKSCKAARQGAARFPLPFNRLLRSDFPMNMCVRNDDGGWRCCSDRALNADDGTHWSWLAHHPLTKPHCQKPTTPMMTHIHWCILQTQSFPSSWSQASDYEQCIRHSLSIPSHFGIASVWLTDEVPQWPDHDGHPSAAMSQSFVFGPILVLWQLQAGK